MFNKTLVVTNTKSSDTLNRYKAYCTCKHYTDTEQGETYYFNAKIESESGGLMLITVCMNLDFTLKRVILICIAD